MNDSTNFGSRIRLPKIGDEVLNKKNTKELDLSNLIAQKDYLCLKYIAGSRIVKFDDLLNNNDLFINFCWTTKNYHNNGQKNLISFLIDSFLNSFNKFLVLSDPGMGKSTLIYLLYIRILDILQKENNNIIPIYIDLKNVIKDSDFGSRNWTFQYLKKVTYINEEEWKIKGENEKGIYKPIIMIDGLDEIISGYSLNEIFKILNYYIFKHANILTCRKQYFYRFLNNTEFVSHFESINLISWDQEMISNYINSYSTFSKCTPEIYEYIKKSKLVLELCKTPLYLNMILDVLYSSEDFNFEVDDLLGLYNIFTNNWLIRESSRDCNILSAEQKIFYLQEISWYFFDEYRRYDEDDLDIVFTRNELKEFFLKKGLGNSDELMNDIIERTFITENRSSMNISGFIDLKFHHRSFQEYYVSGYIFNNMMLNEQCLVECMYSYLYPEVCEFIKEHIKRINKNHRKISQIVSVFFNALNIVDLMEINETNKARIRMCKEQLLYFMGFVRSNQVKKYVEERYINETDPWLRRAIVLGLSFAGDEKYLNMYIENLRNERKDGLSTIENDVNIGFTLSYFGDQLFDVIDPVFDQKQRFCSYTIRRLAYLLNSMEHRGEWRLNLYTILDIEKYRFICHEEFVDTIKEVKNSLDKALGYFEKNNETNWWPEIYEAKIMMGKYRS